MYRRANGCEYQLHVDGGKCESDSVEKHEWENKHSETSLTLCLCAWFLTEMKKNEYDAVKCDKFDNKILVYTWDQV